MNLSERNKILGTSLLLLFASEVTGAYPEVICTEIEGGQYLKFKFQYFFTYPFSNVPFMMYKPMEVISKKAAKKYLVCIDQEKRWILKRIYKMENKRTHPAGMNCTPKVRHKTFGV